MTTCFVGSSALVKRYATELGSTWIRALLDPSVQPRIYLAAVTGVEVVAAISHRMRHVPIRTPVVQVLDDFRYDWTNQYRVMAVDSGLIARAMTLAERHALRGYDAIQLAAAMELGRLSGSSTGILFISSDLELNTAAVSEGFAVEDPNQHP